MKIKKNINALLAQKKNKKQRKKKPKKISIST